MGRRKRINRNFFLPPTLKVARDLLGQELVHQVGKKKIRGRIVETEAYLGPQDLASHTVNGKVTKRNRAVYMEGGHLYLYLIYGMYWMLNISTGHLSFPQCVLIRALEPLDPYPGRCKLANGPGKLSAYLKLDRRHYGLDLVTSRQIWLEKGEDIPPAKIVSRPRVNIDYAGSPWIEKPWRFYIKGHPCVSQL